MFKPDKSKYSCHLGGPGATFYANKFSKKMKRITNILNI